MRRVCWNFVIAFGDRATPLEEFVVALLWEDEHEHRTLAAEATPHGCLDGMENSEVEGTGFAHQERGGSK